MGVRRGGQEGSLAPPPLGWPKEYGKFCPHWKKVCGRPWVSTVNAIKQRFSTFYCSGIPNQKSLRTPV